MLRIWNRHEYSNKKDCDGDRRKAKDSGEKGVVDGTELRKVQRGRVRRLLLLHPQREMASEIVFPEFLLLPPPPPSLPSPLLPPRGPRRQTAP